MGEERRAVDVDVDRLVAAVCEAGGVAHGQWLVAVGEPSGGWAEEAVNRTELRLTATLRSLVPSARVVGRRAQVADDPDAPLWVLDPVGGAEDFARGFPGWCVSAGLVTWLGLLAGVVYLPALGDVYLYLDGTVTWRTRPVTVVADAALHEGSTLLVPPADPSFGAGLPGARRCLGSTAVHMLYVARGAASGGYATGVTAGEIAVALPFLRAAGGEACYRSGEPVSISELLEGGRAPEPVAFAAAQLLDEVRRGAPPNGNPPPTGGV